MKKNQSLIRKCLVYSAAWLLFCGSIISFATLEEPLFLQNYLYLTTGATYTDNPKWVFETNNASEYFYEFFMQYVRNTDDEREIISIAFPELPDSKADVVDAQRQALFPVYINDIRNGTGSIQVGEYGSYRIETIFVTLHTTAITEPQVLSQAVIQYDNGDTQTISTGSIHLYPKLNPDGCLAMESFTRSPDGVSVTEYRARRNITLEEVALPLTNMTKSMVSLTINGVDYLEVNGLQLSAGDKLIAKAEFNPYRSSLKYNQYELLPIIYFTNEDGDRLSAKVLNVNYWPQQKDPFSYPGLLKYKFEREREQ